MPLYLNVLFVGCWWRRKTTEGFQFHGIFCRQTETIDNCVILYFEFSLSICLLKCFLLPSWMIKLFDPLQLENIHTHNVNNINKYWKNIEFHHLVGYISILVVLMIKEYKLKTIYVVIFVFDIYLKYFYLQV